MVVKPAALVMLFMIIVTLIVVRLVLSIPTTLELVVMLMIASELVIVFRILFFRLLLVKSTIGVVRFATFSKFHLYLPLIEWTLTIHLLDSLHRILVPREFDISEPTTVACLVVLDHVD
jgi:hypothetical protein